MVVVFCLHSHFLSLHHKQIYLNANGPPVYCFGEGIRGTGLTDPGQAIQMHISIFKKRRSRNVNMTER